MRAFALLCGLLFAIPAHAFVLMSNRAATLPVTPASPTLNFVWAGDTAPPITEKEKFQNGIYADQTDLQFMTTLLQVALDQWNNVRGSFLRLDVNTVTTSDVVLDAEDGVYSIVVEHSENLTTAAFAKPIVDEEVNQIKDCDISISDRSTSANFFLKTLVHELGHCIGLGHNHSNYGAIMGYSREGESAALGADDKAGIIFLYPDPVYGSEPRELVACGTLASDLETGWPAVILLAPTLAPFVLRRRRWVAHAARG